MFSIVAEVTRYSLGSVDQLITESNSGINQSTMTPIYLVVSIHHEQDPSKLTIEAARDVCMGQG